jgi:hypothetical protein
MAAGGFPMHRFKLSSLHPPALVLLTVLAVHPALWPCTVAVVSGKATPDGRPLLWKNRDTSTLDNKIVRFTGGKYAFIAIVDADDKSLDSVWAGINTAGFAIMNSASLDLAVDRADGNENGTFMKLALSECASASDFESLLRRTNGKRRTAANYGIIDADGNACLYETSAAGFEKFDADDPKVSPRAYVVRTNYAFTAPKPDTGGGYIRFERASHLFQAASDEGRLDYRFILREAARDLANEKLHSYPLSNPRAGDPASPLYVNTSDTINRISTASVALFHGVIGRKKAPLATMWVILGEPVCSVAVPLWAAAESVPDPLTGPATAPLNDLARSLFGYLYPEKRGHMNQYMSVTRLVKGGPDGILGRLLSVEDRVFAETEAQVEDWEAREPGPDKKDLAAFQKKTAAWVCESLKGIPGRR